MSWSGKFPFIWFSRCQSHQILLKSCESHGVMMWISCESLVNPMNRCVELYCEVSIASILHDSIRFGTLSLHTTLMSNKASMIGWNGMELWVGCYVAHDWSMVPERPNANQSEAALHNQSVNLSETVEENQISVPGSSVRWVTARWGCLEWIWQIELSRKKC